MVGTTLSNLHSHQAGFRSWRCAHGGHLTTQPNHSATSASSVWDLPDGAAAREPRARDQLVTSGGSAGASAPSQRREVSELLLMRSTCCCSENDTCPEFTSCQSIRENAGCIGCVYLREYWFECMHPKNQDTPKILRRILAPVDIFQVAMDWNQCILACSWMATPYNYKYIYSTIFKQ